MFLQELSGLYDEQEVESFFYLTLESFHQKKRIDLALNPEMEMDALQLLRWESVLDALKKQKPIQYILGATEFYGLVMLVNENVLIPRPETEELVELILRNSDSNSELKILDIGTGSGCIPIALKANLPKATVSAIDVSEKALATAQNNAILNKIEVSFIVTDILKTEDLGNKYDVIVSNPPYVRHLEKSELKMNVLGFEPHLALFVTDEDPLVFYRKIIELATRNLNPNGRLYFEINQYLSLETLGLFNGKGFNSVQLHKDIYGNDRMISAVYS